LDWKLDFKKKIYKKQLSGKSLFDFSALSEWRPDAVHLLHPLLSRACSWGASCVLKFEIFKK